MMYCISPNQNMTKWNRNRLNESIMMYKMHDSCDMCVAMRRLTFLTVIHETNKNLRFPLLYF